MGGIYGDLYTERYTEQKNELNSKTAEQIAKEYAGTDTLRSAGLEWREADKQFYDENGKDGSVYDKHMSEETEEEDE